MKLSSRHFFYFLLFLLPSQLGKHFWLSESLVLGRRIDYASPTLYFTDLLIFVCLGLLFIEKKIQKPPYFTQILVGLSVLSTLWLMTSSVPIITLFWLFRLYQLFLFGIIVYSLRPRATEIIVPLLSATAYTTLLALGQFLHQGSIGGLWYALGERTFTHQTPGIAQAIISGRLYLRPYATLPHPNVLGGFLVVVFLLCLQWKNQYNRLHRFAFRIGEQVAVFGMLTGLFLSLSRTAWITFVLLVGARWVHKTKKLYRYAHLFLIGIALFFAEEIVLGRFQSLFSIDTESVVERQQLASAALKLIQEHLFLGMGPGTFIHNISQALPTGTYLLQPVHSIYLLLLAETGIVGFVVFLIIALLAFKKSLQHKTGYWLPLLAIFLIGLFDHYFVTLWQTQLLFVLILSLCLISPPNTSRLNT